ncbi:hypothetical protein G7Y79_00028g062350 [Physcia stellaris]|nr:hypothetical protein G7Y79_00028g062350 [Physcia stellaris]
MMDWARDRLPDLSWTTKSSLPRRVLISYILDYVILVILFVTFQALDAVEPYHQHFALQNYTLQYPFARHERVPIALAFTVAVVLPVLIIAFYTLVIDGIFSHQTQGPTRRGGGRARYTFQERLWELNCGILGLLLSEGVAFVITGALKNEIGKPRPDLIDRCRPKEGSVDPTTFGLSTSSICTQKDHGILKDGFRSFPSGHSSSAFAGLFYLSLYLAGKLHVLDNRGEVWKTFVVLVPTLAAALIAGSRIMDARHHPFDVISGSLLGIVVAWCAYRQYFPPVSEPWHKGRAYPIRSWGTEPKVPRQDYQEMPRDHSPLELSRVSGQATWEDPERGPGHAGVSNPLTNTHGQPWNVGDVSRRDFSNHQNDGAQKHHVDEHKRVVCEEDMTTPQVPRLLFILMKSKKLTPIWRHCLFRHQSHLSETAIASVQIPPIIRQSIHREHHLSTDSVLRTMLSIPTSVIIVVLDFMEKQKEEIINIYRHTHRFHHIKGS